MACALSYGLLALSAGLTLAEVPVLHLYNGHIPIEHPSTDIPIQQFVVGQPYTFEIYMGNVLHQDYIVDTCSLNGRTFIDSNGCVLCGDGILSSIETEQYARAGAVKRTLVHFIAKEEVVNIACNIRVLDCCGCAERSCERRQPLVMFPAVTHSLVYPVVITKGPSFPIWLLILLILLLLICLLSVCCIPLLLMRKRRKAVTTVVADEKRRGIGVETEKTIVKDTGVGCKNVHMENGAFYHVTPAVAVEDREPITRTTEMYSREERRVCVTPEEDYGRSSFFGVRERARSSETEARRSAQFRDTGVSADRSSYRNYAYQRDRGGVAPVEGFDQIETRERRYCWSDDEDYELVEKDVKRTHTSRFMEETRQIHDDDVSSVGERCREEDVHHAVYSQSLPV